MNLLIERNGGNIRFARQLKISYITEVKIQLSICDFTMNTISEAFTFPFKDPNWLTKFFIGAMFVVLSFFLIGIPVLYGYCIEIQQRVRRGEQQVFVTVRGGDK